MSFYDKSYVNECARHVNGIKRDNRLTNLEWGTYSDNNYDRAGHKERYNSDVNYVEVIDKLKTLEKDIEDMEVPENDIDDAVEHAAIVNECYDTLEVNMLMKKLEG